MKKLYTENTVGTLAQGVSAVAEIVGTTLGGRGKNVVIKDEQGMIHIINDGVTIADQITLEDEGKDAGASLAKQVARLTNQQSGDGTTTSILLLDAYLKMLMTITVGAKKSEAREMREKIQAEVERITEELTATKRTVVDSELENVAKISCLDEEMAKVIASVIREIGRDGAIMVDDAQKAGISYEVVQGIQINDGYTTPYLITQTEGGKSVIDDVPVLLSRRRIDDLPALMPLLEEIGKMGKSRKIAIFAKEFSDDVVTFFVVNKVQGKINPILVTTDDLEEIATTTNAKIITYENGMKFNKDVLGEAGKVITTAHKTIVLNGQAPHETVTHKIGLLKKQLEEVESPAEKYALQERIAKLSGGVAVIKIAGQNFQESREKKLKMEDAINAVKSAIEEGVVLGGGMALYNIAQKFYKSQDTDVKKLMYAVLIAPAFQIIKNADEEDEVFFQLESKGGKGYNVVTREYEDFEASGVLDPVKVTKAALKNAVSMGNIIMTASASVIHEPDANSNNQPR